MRLVYKMKLYYAIYKVSGTLFVLMFYPLLVGESALTFLHGAITLVSLILSVICENAYKQYATQYIREDENHVL